MGTRSSESPFNDSHRPSPSLSPAEALGGPPQRLPIPTPPGRGRGVRLLGDVLQHPVPGAAAGQRLPVPTLRPQGAALEPPAAQPAGRDQAPRRRREPPNIWTLRDKLILD